MSDVANKKLPSVSAVVACYLDAPALREMHQRLTEVFRTLGCDYEVIFVNDGSPDETRELLIDLSRLDNRVLGVNHSRNFGSQMAFRSGMELARKDYVVLLDGDLQDPPETIENLYSKILEGYDVVYGIRAEREMGHVYGALFKLFYRLYSALSDFKIPRDAGDFSIMNRRVVRHLLKFEEKDLFLRGLRAYVGFTQVGVPYVRPARPYGRSTNNLKKNLLWARMAIFSVSTRPLTILSELGAIVFVGSVAFAGYLFVSRVFLEADPVPGVAMLGVLVTLLGGFNLLALGILGEYIAKILQEVKNRPAPIRDSLISGGEVTALD